MATAADEHRLQMRIIFVLALLGGLIALGFSQSAGLFKPPSIIAAGAQTPAATGEPVIDTDGTGVPIAGVTGPRTGASNFVPRTPATGPGETRQAPTDEGLGGPIETADASGAIPPSIAEDLAAPPSGGATPSEGVTPSEGNGAGPNGPGVGDPGTSGPGANVPGITGPGTGGGTDPNVPTPTTPVPEPATWLILIVGIAIVGGALRRRGAGLSTSRQLARG